MAQTLQIKWLASLSDGRTAIEGEPPFHFEPGELSPWQKLLKELRETGVEIVAMRIQVVRDGEPTMTLNLPSGRVTSSGTHWRYTHIHPRIPIAFTHGRRVEGGEGGIDWVHCFVTAVFDDFEVSIFVDEADGTTAWVIVNDKRDNG